MTVLSPVASTGTLRERFTADMSVRGFSAKTQHDYLRTVAGFAAFLGRSPSTATAEDIRCYQIEQSERGMNAPAINSAVAALRFFFNHTVNRPDLAGKLIRLRYPRKMPVVLSSNEAGRLIAATTCLKHRAALSVAYGAGLRVAEVAQLKVGNIDSERMLIVAERAKGDRQRHGLTHHPHIHMIVPGGGISLDGQRWVSSRPTFLLPVRVLGKLFRRLFLTRLVELFEAGRLRFFGKQAGLCDRATFQRHLAPVRKKPWIVYAKPPFAGPAAVLAYLSRYTHRVAISNRRLMALDERGVTFRYKDYRREGAERYRTMTLPTGEFLRRFLLHVLPRGFYRIRHYGLLASGRRRDNLARARELLEVSPPPLAPEVDKASEPTNRSPPCPCCGGQMLILETFERFAQPRAPPRPTNSPGRCTS